MEKIPEDPETFINALKETLGLSALIVEDVAVRRLQSSLKMEESIHHFSEIVNVRKVRTAKNGTKIFYRQKI